MTLADELERAADHLTELVEQIASEGWGDRPWHVEDCADAKDPERGCPCLLAQGEHRPFEEAQVPAVRYLADVETPEVAEYLATMNTRLVRVVADLLRAEATRLRRSTHPEWQETVSPLFAALAEEINRGVEVLTGGDEDA